MWSNPFLAIPASLALLTYLWFMYMSATEARRAFRQACRVATAQTRLATHSRTPNFGRVAVSFFHQFMRADEEVLVGPYRFAWSPDAPVKINREAAYLVDMTV